MKKKICKFCGLPETTKGGHKPLDHEPPNTVWRKLHIGHPNFKET